MIIIYSPFRISLFGGGTDIPSWFKKNKGITVSGTINRGAYVSLNNVFYRHDDKKIKVSYKNTEIVKDINQIKIPIVKEALKKYWEKAIEINYNSDLPSRSGMGTSSAFSAALIKGLYFLNKKTISKKLLATKSIELERKILLEPGGYQDQIATVYGGFNKITYKTDGLWNVNSLKVSNEFTKYLESLIYLIPLKKKRKYRKVNYWDESFQKNYKYSMSEIYSLGIQGYKSLIKEDICSFNNVLKNSWDIKKNMNDISFKEANELYDSLINLGALSGKLLGSGGGGFLLMLMDKKIYKKAINKNLIKNAININFESRGTHVIFDGKFK